MGPRLGSRGKIFSFASLIIFLSSFNGAATWKSRKVFPKCKAGEILGTGFNGAATWKSRKAVSPSSSSLEYIGFNGAATWKSRKDFIESIMQSGLALLQWGRDLEVAEST